VTDARHGKTKEISYEVRPGSGAEKLILLHAIGTDRSLWDDVAADWSGVGTLVLCDLPGHGSAPDPVGEPTMFDLADSVVEAMDAEGIDTAHVVGISLGGMIGLAMAVRHPDRLASLVAADARVDAPEDYRRMWDGLIATAEGEGMGPIATFMGERWFGADPAARPPGAARVVASLNATRPAGFVAASRAIQGLDFEDALATITCPTLLAVGENDGALPEKMKYLSTLVPGCGFVEIAGAGHLPAIDNPEAFADAVASFIARQR
jgi:3-oxoadipate enol-lactonase